MSVSQAVANVFYASERDKNCEARNNGDHLWGEWGQWIEGNYKKKGMPRTLLWNATGKAYWKRVRVCKDCRKRQVEVKSEEPGGREDEQMGFLWMK